MTARFRNLARQITTRQGTYTAGLPVLQIPSRRPGQVRICLDPQGTHFGDRCHSLHVPPTWLMPTKAETVRQEAA